MGESYPRFESISFSPSSSSSASSSTPHHITIQLPSKKRPKFHHRFSLLIHITRESSSYPLNPRQTHTSAYRKSIEATHLVFLLSLRSQTNPRKSSSLRYFREIIIGVVVVDVVVVVVLSEARDEKGRKTI